MGPKLRPVWEELYKDYRGYSLRSVKLAGEGKAAAMIFSNIVLPSLQNCTKSEASLGWFEKTLRDEKEATDLAEGFHILSQNVLAFKTQLRTRVEGVSLDGLEESAVSCSKEIERLGSKLKDHGKIITKSLCLAVGGILCFAVAGILLSFCAACQGPILLMGKAVFACAHNGAAVGTVVRCCTAPALATATLGVVSGIVGVGGAGVAGYNLWQRPSTGKEEFSKREEYPNQTELLRQLQQEGRIDDLCNDVDSVKQNLDIVSSVFDLLRSDCQTARKFVNDASSPAALPEATKPLIDALTQCYKSLIIALEEYEAGVHRDQNAKKNEGPGMKAK